MINAGAKRVYAGELPEKESYTGSYRGMRFKMMKAQVGEGEEERTVLRVIHWPEPYGFEATEEEKRC